LKLTKDLSNRVYFFTTRRSQLLIRLNYRYILKFSAPSARGADSNRGFVRMGARANSQPTVLLVDDEESDRDMICATLRTEGFAVLQAGSYQEAYGRFEANRDSVDLLVADISLPDGNGCELALAIRDSKPDLRVLFVSGHVGAEVCRFYGLDVTDLYFLRKPFAANELSRSVQQVFAGAEPFPRLYMKTRLARGES
jgi:CheY-like chemotaxis protein